MIRKLIKTAKILRLGNAKAIRALRYGVAASVEHDSFLRSLTVRTVLDVGANRGQFALIASALHPQASIVSFEPLRKPAEKYERVFADDRMVRLHKVAIGQSRESMTMNVSGRDDSSSLLPISDLQGELYPGTSSVDTEDVAVMPLTEVIASCDIKRPVLMKIDVQGFELSVLKGAREMLDRIDDIYCECSFVELYEGQALASTVIEWLRSRGFELSGIYNLATDDNGLPVQADFHFHRSD